MRFLRPLFFVYVAATCIHLAYVVYREPFAFDAWNVAVDTGAEQASVGNFFEFWWNEYTHSNPRIGQPASYLSYKVTGFAELGTPLAFMAIVLGAFTLAVGRRPSTRDGRDLATLTIGIGLLWIASPNLPAYMFCRAYATNYIWTAALQLWFAVALFRHDADERRPSRLAGIALFGILAGMANEHVGPTLMLFCMVYAYLKWRKSRQIALYPTLAAAGVLVGFLLIFFAPGQSERYDEFLNVRHTVVEQVLVRGIAGNLDILYGMPLAAAPLMTVMFTMLGFAVLVRAADTREIHEQQRRALGFVALCVVAGVLMAMTVFASPKLGPRFYIHGMVLLLGGVLGVARTYLERPRHYAPFVVIAVAISIYAGARTVPMFTRLDRDSDQRLAELEALAPGKTYTANGWEQVNEGWFFLGDDFRDQKKRELVARYFALRRVLFRGGELWGTLGVSDAKLVMRYELEPAVCIDQLETIDVKQYLGRDVATLHRTFLEQVDEIRFATPARIKFIDVLVGFSGERPPLPRQTVYLARWRDGVLEGYTASMHRRGRSTTRVLTLSDQLKQSSWDIYLVSLGDPPRLLGTSTASTPLEYQPWRTSPYWALACKPDHCFVIFSTLHGA